jgi:hypothetical protein
MPTGITFSALELEGDKTCALTSSGVLYCWGLVPPNQTIPTLVSLPAGMKDESKQLRYHVKKSDEGVMYFLSP